MAFSSSYSNGDNDCFSVQNGFYPPSFQFGSSSSRPEFLEEDHFFVDKFLPMSQGVHQPFLLGHDGNLNNHDFLDAVMEAGSLDGNNQTSCGIVLKEKVDPGQINKTNAVGGSPNVEIDEKDYCQPVKKPAKRIRTGKKDRHSKICTAQGPRDRRMRLSLQIARKFFDLQDTLGFDKASKTIEWLFNMSKDAIREVMGTAFTREDERKKSHGDQYGGTCNTARGNSWKNDHLVTPLSEIEDVFFSSNMNHSTTNQKTKDHEDFPTNKLKRINEMCKRRKLRSNDQIPNWPQQRKDVRNKARARARERTEEKMRLKAQKGSNLESLEASDKTETPNPSYQYSCSEQIGSCSALERVDSGAQSQSVEELIHAEWEDMEDARLYSSYILFHDTTLPEHQHVLNSGINHDVQSSDTISFTSSASQMFSYQLCLSNTTSANE